MLVLYCEINQTLSMVITIFDVVGLGIVFFDMINNVN